MLLEKHVKGSSHCSLRGGKARPLCVGRIAHQRQHALFADLRKTLQVDGVPEHRCVIHLKVSRVYHDSRRRINGKSRRVHDTVICFDKFNAELPQIDGLSEFNHLPLGVVR